jgi:deoxyxylulose-5-phosphate synthase
MSSFPPTTAARGTKATGAARAMGMDSAPAGFGSALLAAAAQRPEIVAVTADLGRYTELTEFARRYPERLINVGMAEQNLVAVAGGLAMAGLRPVATTFAAFLTRRAQDFVVMQIALPRHPVVLVGGIPGICPSFGPSHASVDDLAAMRAVPGMVVLDPCDAVQQALATEAALAHDGPVYMRKLRGREPVVYDRAHGHRTMVALAEHYAQLIPMGRVGRPDEIASEIAFSGLRRRLVRHRRVPRRRRRRHRRHRAAELLPAARAARGDAGELAP